MSNLPKVPNLFCDPTKSRINFNGEKLPGTSSEGGLCTVLACGAYYILFYASHMEIYAA